MKNFKKIYYEDSINETKQKKTTLSEASHFYEISLILSNKVLHFQGGMHVVFHLDLARVLVYCTHNCVLCADYTFIPPREF